ncbi:hypothetical protein GJAV_G00067520 [Gymnothorax javanicus]|nr:hypothetical protein GJAV_G00067520 [Gymnothorax javanicus]
MERRGSVCEATELSVAGLQKWQDAAVEFCQSAQPTVGLHGKICSSIAHTALRESQQRSQGASMKNSFPRNHRCRPYSGPSARITNMPPYTITYFAVRGRCGAMRIALADLGQEWKEVDVSFEDWMKGDLKATCVFGQLPKIDDGNLALFQSNAILRHLGRKHGAYGKDDTQAATIDMLTDGVEDLRLKYINLIYKEYETGKDAYITDLPNHLCYFEAVLAKSTTGFLVGDKASIADYTLLDVMLNHLVLSPKCLDSFPKLKSFVDKMSARPKIKAYMDSDAYKKLPINGNGKQ